MTELAVLQAVRLKGRLSHDALLAIVDDGSEVVAELVASGLLVQGPTLRLSPDGRTRLTELLRRERAGIDAAVVAQIYTRFCELNAEFKTLVSGWQLGGGREGGDVETLATELDGIQQRIAPVVAAAASQVPRLAGYVDRLAAALVKVRSGDLQWLAHPVVDSYHTVWFELHEELLGATGLTRADEAAAGRAE